MSDDKWSHLPTSLPGGSLLPHMSARLRTETIDALFVGLGGYEKAKAFFQKNDDNYLEFVKIWAKGAARSSNVEVTASEGIESMLKRLDERDRARELTIIDSTAETVVVDET